MEHEQAVVCELLNVQSGRSMVLVAVYAQNTIDQRKQVWGFLVQHLHDTNRSVLVGGDFNAILSPEDRYQGNTVHNVEVVDFQQCLQECNLQEVRAIGPQYTWDNNQVWDHRICSNIDRCFASAMWFNEYADTIVERLEKSISDHCPQLLRFEAREARRGFFKFYNVIADHEMFEQIVRDNWGTERSQSLLKDVWRKCHKLKTPLKELNTKWFLKTNERVCSLRQKLQLVQIRLQQDPVGLEILQEEKTVLGELEKWSNIEENIWQQKARIDWLKLGDSNTKFFHAYAKMRKSANAIHRLTREDGSICLGQTQIKKEVREFYTKLMGTAAQELLMVDKRVVERGPKLTAPQQQMLNAACSAQEVHEALFSMDSNKAPGVDGFNVYFFKKSWSIIGQEVTQAVQQFFVTGYLPRELNVALLTLLPKRENATSMREFRPIACCTVLYKVISKVLANRLKGVLDTIICGSQSAFVPGRLIFDNIIISHGKQVSPRCMVKVDIQKAYDSVEWPFVRQMMYELGFPYRFVQWVMECLTTVEYIINVNGEQTVPF